MSETPFESIFWSLDNAREALKKQSEGWGGPNHDHFYKTPYTYQALDALEHAMRKLVENLAPPALPKPTCLEVCEEAAREYFSALDAECVLVEQRDETVSAAWYEAVANSQRRINAAEAATRDALRAQGASKEEKGRILPEAKQNAGEDESEG